MADQPTPLEPDPTPAADASAAGPLASDDPQYHSLYRRFRPQRFSEVRGQEHVTRALRNAVRDGRVAHAYLFSGPRGTGKTSTARILAMALNCTNLQDGEPCGVCESCVEIRRGASVDVHELDAASNRKLDEMRDLLSRVALGTPGRSKVYIIDEVHQLTGDSASALLKTLEEPPGHVVFVLATTDPQKVLPTIRSRTLHFEFHLLASDVLGELLRTVNNQAGLGVAPEAIDLVVRRGHGSARDALTVLDQVAAAGEVEDEATVVAEIVDGLAERDAGRVLLAVAEGMAAGRDARRLAADILDRLRNGFLATMAKGLVMLPDDGVASVEEQARRLGPAALVRAMEGIGEALTAMRDSVDPRVTLEVALVRQARPDVDHSPAALLERVERLERIVAKGGSGHPPPGQPAAAAPVPAAVVPAAAPALAQPGRDPALRPALGAHRQPAAVPPAPPAVTAPAPPPRPSLAPDAAAPSLPLPSRDELTKAWGDGVLRCLPGKARSRFASGRFLEVSDGAAVFAVPDKHLLGRCEETRSDAEAALAARFGRAVPIRLVLDPGGSATPPDGTPPDGTPPDGEPAGPPGDDGPPARSGSGSPTGPTGSSGSPLRSGSRSPSGSPAPAGPPGPPSELDDPTFGYNSQDVADLEDAGPAVTSPEQRLLEAFPGAEEVSP